MEHTTESTPRHPALIICAVLAALASGCGDGFGGGGSAFGSALASHVKDEMGGAQVELTLYTGCEGMGSENLDTRCSGIRSAEIEVFFDASSVVFDFSNAPKPGAISETGFEGYVLSIPETSRLPALLGATLDAGASNVDAERIQIESDDARVVVDFQGLEYDDTTFVKVDLEFAEGV